MYNGKVDTTHPEYDDNKIDWQIVRDCVAGESKVKSRRTEYLPYPSTDGKYASNRYERYITRASFYNATGRTRNALLGAIYRNNPTVTVPSDMEWVFEDFDGNQTDISNLSRQTTIDLLETGRSGLLVDFPKVDKSITISESKLIHPIVLPYIAESIINWDTETEKGISKLSLVVLKERITVKKSDFEIENEYQYRVLKLDENGNYVQEIWFDDQIIEVVEPRNSVGAPFKYIPFIFVGSQRNSTIINKSPLLDIARINIAHFRNSADLEEMMFLVGQAMLGVTGLDQSWINSNFPNGITVGSSQYVPLPVGADLKYVQPNGDQLIANQLKEKEMQMQMLGARLLQQGSGEAAETVRMRQSGEAAILESIAKNVSYAYYKALIYCCEFSGSNPNDINFELNTDFFSQAIEPQRIVAIMNLYEDGLMTKREVRELLKAGEMIDPEKTYEQFLEEQDQEGID